MAYKILVAGVMTCSALVWPGRAADRVPVPDFSGPWARTSLGFESPATGRGPIKNRVTRPDGTSNFGRLVGDYTDPLLKPQAAAALKALGDISLRNEAFPQPSNQCLPYPPAYSSSNNQLIELLQEKDRVTILTMFDHQLRQVRLNARHPAKPTPSWYGDSIGHYEGDTLVVDTIAIKPGPYPMVDIYGTPFSEKLHVVERFRLVDYPTAAAAMRQGERENQVVGGLLGDGVDIDRDYRGVGLELRITVEDAGTFTQPWTGVVTYLRAAGGWDEMVCAENTQEYYVGKETAIPVAKRPDF
jgi:hypothetical protein